MTNANPANIAATFSSGIYDLPNLAALLGVQEVVFAPSNTKAQEIRFVVGWGQKPNTAQAREYASKHNLPFVALEDGFLRSIGLGVNGSPPLSIIIDDVGVYYDATAPSSLEKMLNNTEDTCLDDDKLLQRARQCIKNIRQHQLSKYNDSPAHSVTLPLSRNSQTVLVIDQTANDMSLKKGLMHECGFQGMLDAAIHENPDAHIVLKLHPDVVAGKKKANFNNFKQSERITVLTEHINPIALLEQVDKVYTMTSQMGFEALMLNKSVTCFGMPFYAGWGLTDDRVSVSRRTATRSLHQLFAAAYIMYPKYIVPDSGETGAIEDVIEHLALQRRQFKKNAGNFFCFGFSKWKQAHIREFLKSPGNSIRFCNSARSATSHGFDSNATIVAWGARKAEVVDALKQTSPSAWRIEDGFLRSTSLGSDLTAPASLVIDQHGIYFDPRTPSDLENILNTRVFSEENRNRADNLRRAILANGLSKYNISSRDTLTFPTDQKIILVPGQVESDASIAAGCIDVCTNEDLAAAARESNPDAFIAFKPHPDVVVQNRSGKAVYGTIAENCDLIIENESISACIDKADEIHTMTSLVGFEALMRLKKVVSYGQPFYSGWGLTEDKHPHPRRNRKLKLAELVYATLIEYPVYVNWRTHSFTSPEFIVHSLARQMQKKQPDRSAPGIRQQLKRLRNLLKGILNAK